MHSDSKGFFDNITTGGTLLRCPSGVNFPIPSPGTFSLGFEYCEEHPPRCVRDTFSKMPIFDHALNVKGFYSKTIVALNQRVSSFMAKVKSLIGNLLMMISDKNAGFLSTDRTFLPTGKPSLGFGKFLFSQSQIFRRRYLLSIAGGNEGVESDINANRFPSCREGVRLRLNGKRDIPLAISSCDRESLHIAVNRSMPLNFDTAYILEVETVVFYLAAISKRGIGYCIESIRRLKARITGLFTSRGPAEERLKGFIEPAKGLLKGTVVTKSNASSFFSQLRKEACGLGRITNTLTGLLIYFFALCKGLVVKKTVPVKLSFEGLNLFTCRVEFVFVGFNHLFFLVFIPIRRFAFWTNPNFGLFRNPLMPTAFTAKFNYFNFHTSKHNLKASKCQKKILTKGGYAIYGLSRIYKKEVKVSH